MMIRPDFTQESQLPPRMFLEQVLNDLSKSYCFLWDKKNEQNIVDLTWKDIKKFYSKNSFRTNLRKLNNEGLLSYKESEDGIAIELVGWDNVNSDDW